MALSKNNRFLNATPILGGTVAFLVFWVQPAITQQSAADQNWRSYGGDIKNTRYSPLTQIDATNFSRLQVAWIFSTANLGPDAGDQSGVDAAGDRGRALFHGRGPARCGRAGRRHGRGFVDAIAKTKGSALRFRPGVSPAAASRTGRTAMTSGSSTSRRDIG